jgi:hypothetical protein
VVEDTIQTMDMEGSETLFNIVIDFVGHNFGFSSYSRNIRQDQSVDSNLHHGTNCRNSDSNLFISPETLRKRK